MIDTVPPGVHPRPRRSDWLALWTGVAIWLSPFLALCVAGWVFLWE
jgi:paraquat-inducible protein B